MRAAPSSDGDTSAKKLRSSQTTSGTQNATLTRTSASTVSVMRSQRNDLEDRDGHHDRRHHLGEDEHREEAALAGDIEAGECVGRGRSEHDDHQRGQDSDTCRLTSSDPNHSGSARMRL